ncbi:hypothetical protein N480_03605 [Pseudoalteromonas luteoviolacea S2607]|uniref:hypothetical protein n=1 Tax=Pseudoalteromonas luteoviolacea TaxID=43657 RepID=UPI0007B0A8AD|nr:hypothetical protein [Pseudoalteromonas luteoviolacea]KZN30043.1 hypothetical protein N480_03605 [Pseudoalteromonas luteoviolacea S2607]
MNTSTKEKPTGTPLNCLLLAGVGGMIPTMSRLASTYVTDPMTPLPEPGLFFGLGLFFVIGVILAYAFSETNVRQAFIIGVCAPGIITNIVAGVQEANTNVSWFNGVPFISSAYAQDLKAPRETEFLEQEPVEPLLRLKNKVVSGSEWDAKTTSYSVTAILADGSTKSIGRFPAKSLTQELLLPISADKLLISAGRISQTIPLPTEPFSSIELKSDLVYSNKKNDFLWALGAKRETQLSSFHVNIHNVNFIDNSLSVKGILGLKVAINQNVRGDILEDIKISPDGRLGDFIVRLKDGTLKSFLPSKVKVADSIVYLDVRSTEANNSSQSGS